ncbi:DUF5347 family protein [Xenorhabdus japonica]|uniref:Uncharacterized protein n=1 Tax=Xenorhabdus japonica TaxID=53341 RepID=A0A1I5AVP2_9GAMM|nr:DUF5347 family protein [Xenorhabdus japonica]SFN66508.1 hypothetical protein SAMN05421579_11436 [Xenorhabdus japonica]
MANTEKEKFAQINLGQRLEGLNHLSRIRATYWGDDEKELNRFIQGVTSPYLPHAGFICTRIHQ